MDRRATDRRKEQDNNIYIPDIFEIWDMFYKHKKMVLITILLPTLLCFVFLKSSAKTYRATSSVILENENLNLSDFHDILQTTKFDNLTVPTQIEVITSISMVKNTIASLQKSEKDTKNFDKYFKDLSIKDFLKNLHVNQQGTSRVINISYDSKNPEVAAKIANTHTKVYVYSLIEAKKSHAKKINDWVSQQIENLKTESVEKSQAVQKFKSDNGMIKGLNSEDLIYQQISDIAKQLSPIETKELDLKARVELVRNGKDDSIREVITSDLIQRLKTRSSETAQKLQSLRTDFGKNHPEVIATQRELSQINYDMNREISNIRKSIENELETTSSQKRFLNEKLEELQNKADTLQEKQIELQSLEISEAASRKQLDNFFVRSEEIKSQIDFARADVNIVSEAEIPIEPKSSKKVLVIAAVLILSSVFAIMMVIFTEIIASGISRKDDVQRLLNIKLLGTLPKEYSPLSRVLSKQRSQYIEQIKRIYIQISADKNIKTILFTAAKNNEGKTLTAVAMAYYLGSIGKKIIIIDANTIKPKISLLTNTNNEPGFYELLSKEATLNDVISDNENSISVIPAGAQATYSSDYLLSGAFTPYLEELKTAFDYIIIDTASANETSDAELLAQLCDHTIIVCTWAKTPKKMLKGVCDKIKTLSGNKTSLILNKTPTSEIEN